MIKKINADALVGDGPIRVLYPGLAVSESDTGLASIGRIDHAKFEGNTTISMHPHVNDEILTYLRAGYVEHLDSEGYTAKLDSTHLMLMKAGASFFHEEKIIDKGEPLEGLQIFIRPASKDLAPVVSFLTLDKATSVDTWRLLTSPDGNTKLQFTSRTWVYDIRCSDTGTFSLPLELNEGMTALLYVFGGEIIVNHKTSLSKYESLIVDNESISLCAVTTSDLVLFVTDRSASWFAGGMFSGNQTCLP